MDKDKREKLEKAGWKVGTVEEFLGLSQFESELIEIKLALSQRVKQNRLNQKMSQEALAKVMGSSQSRVAKI